MSSYRSRDQGIASYKKVHILPRRLEIFLQNKHPDVFKAYLEVAPKRKEVSAKKAVIHSEPNQATKMYLIQDDVVEVLETQSGWVKIKYVTAKGKTIIGWLKEKDLDVKE